MKKIMVTIGAIALLLSTAHAAVWYVHPDSVQNCIQDCLDACATGDTVLVGSGTYYENIVWPSTHGVDLVSENGSATTILDGGNTDRVIQITTGVDSTTVIRGFTIQNGYALAGAGIRCANYSSPVIKGNTITRNVVDSAGAGISCAYYSSPVIDSNSIVNNTSSLIGAGILCWDYCHPTISRNMIADNYADFGSAGICIVSSTPIIIENTITRNTGVHWFGGIGAGMASAPTIRDNVISDNEATWGAGIGLEGYGVVVGNTISGNTADSMGGGIAAYTQSGPQIDSNLVDSNFALRGAGIWVHEQSNPQIRYNTISRNTALKSGGGIRCSDYSSPYIYDNTVEDNYADSAGAGIVCINNSSPSIINNTISGNAIYGPGGAGIFCMDNCSPDIIGNLIEENSVDYGAGGGIFCWTSSPNITRNTIVNNTATRAGGIQCWIWSSPEIKHNIITYNSSPGHGCGINCGETSSPDIDSCTVANNTGDGIYCETGSLPTINYVNIYGNTEYGVLNYSAVVIDAENNWWGDSSGPGGVGPGTGDEVGTFVDYIPWLRDSVEGVGVEEYVQEDAAVRQLQVYPNPFSKLTNINFEVDSRQKSVVSIQVYDICGRLVKSFDPMPYAPCSMHLSWDGCDDSGSQLPSGVYLLKLDAGQYSETQKLLLVR